jgi:hypothetical protein
LSLEIFFDEPVMPGTGNIELRMSSDGSLFRSVSITDTSRVHFSGNTVTITPDAWATSFDLYVTIGPGVIKDLDGNSFAGISSPTAWNFTSHDGVPPYLSTISPFAWTTGNNVATNIVVTFSEPIVKGTGDVQLIPQSGGLIDIPIGDASQISIAGNTLTINPPSDLAHGMWYEVHLPSGIVTDLASNPYAGADIQFQTGFNALDPYSDFDANGKSDILCQSISGQAAIWLMEGTTFAAGGAAGPNPGTTWHVKGAGDFNGDGYGDILWQNDDGTPVVWFMNGTTMLGGGVLGFNPGSAWKVVGAGDFNGDGKADIAWQNSDGTPAIWLMNGTSLLSGASFANPGSSWHVIAMGS